MLKSSSACFIIFICLINCCASATSVNKEASDSVLSDHLTATSNSPSNQNNPLFTSIPNSELWIKQAFGNDFHDFYTQKVKNMDRKSNTLKLDFHLDSISELAIKSESKVDTSSNTYVEINKTRIEILDVPDIKFADDIYTWNGADITAVKLGNDYQQFINDELAAGQHVSKDIWDGVETTAFEDFVDEHFGFHDSALLRYLALLGGVLFIILGYIFIPKLMEYIYPD